MVNTFFTSCPADCDDDLLLPAIPADQSCTNYEQTRSQVRYLYIRPDGAPDIFASWSTTPTYVAASVDNTVTDNSKTKYLEGIGGIAVPEKTVLEYPGRKKRTGDRTYTLSFRILNLTDDQYEFLIAMQACGWTDFTFYYADLSDYVYGKSGGIVPESVDVDFPKGDGNDDRNYAVMTLTWVATGDPERRVNPHA